MNQLKVLQQNLKDAEAVTKNVALKYAHAIVSTETGNGSAQVLLHDALHDLRDALAAEDDAAKALSDRSDRQQLDDIADEVIAEMNAEVAEIQQKKYGSIKLPKGLTSKNH
jgi:hypothetical protein